MLRLGAFVYTSETFCNETLKATYSAVVTADARREVQRCLAILQKWGPRGHLQFRLVRAILGTTAGMEACVDG